MPSIARITVTCCLLVAVLTGAAAPSAAQAPTPEEELAARYAPIAMLREQEQPCDKDGEGYFPAPVELVLGNPDVALKHMEEGNTAEEDPVITMGPTAPDLAGLGESYYLDFPGDPRHSDCDFENTFKRMVQLQNAEPTTYAHIVVDHFRGKLVLQYWFWFFFNDWNNTHESDWEMIQLVFDATSAEEALTEEPVQVGYAQHGGGELAEWGDEKLGREGDHPRVYPAAGSHGTYYGQELYIGWGENGTGFGCDNSTSPSVPTPLNVVMVPNDPDPDGEFAWLLYDGQWGERENWEFNGPQGPNAGGKWRTPISSMENWRETSLAVPGSNAIGPTATDVFCTLSSAGSELLIELGNRPWLLATLVLGLLGLLAFLFIVKRQELGEALGIYRRHLRTFLGIGLFTIPIGIAFNGLAILAREYPPTDWLLKWFNDTAGARLAAAAVVGGFQQIAMVLLVAPPVIQALRDIRAGRSPGVRRSFQESYRHIGALALAVLCVAVIIGFLALLIIGIPVAIWLAVRWQFFGQAIVMQDARSAPEAIRRSGGAVHGNWWRALGDSLVFQIFAVLPGPFVGALLMLLGKASVDFANAFSSVVFAITVPISVIGLTLAFLRYQGRAAPRAATSVTEPLPPAAGPAKA